MSINKQFSEAELVALLKSDDHSISVAAYTVIYGRYRKPLVLHAYRMLGDAELAKDVVQELFTTFNQQRKTIHISTSLSVYLYKAVRNKVFNNLKHAKVKLNYAEDFFNYTQNSGEQADEQVCLKELVDGIESEMEKIPIEMLKIHNATNKQSELKLAKLMHLPKDQMDNLDNIPKH